MAVLTPEVIAEIMAVSRVRQGLPKTIADAATLDRVAQLVLLETDSSGQRKSRARHAAPALSEVRRDRVEPLD